MADALKQSHADLIRLGALLTAAGFATWFVFPYLKTTQAKIRDASHLLTVSADRLNLGEVFEDDATTVTLPIENRSDITQEVTSFDTCCGLAVTPATVTIPAKQTREVRLTLDLRDYVGRKDPSQTERPFEFALTPRVASIGQPQAPWAVRGIVRRVLMPQTAEVDLGTTSVLARPLQERQVRVKCMVPVGRLEANPSTPELRTSVKPTSDPSEHLLTVTPLRIPQTGSFSASVRLTPFGVRGEVLPGKKIEVKGKVLPDIQALPAFVEFGAQEVGQVGRETICLQSATGRRFEVVKVTTDGEEVTVKQEQAVNGMPVYHVERRVRSLGRSRSTLRFFLRVEGDMWEEAVVDVWGIGVVVSKLGGQ